MSVQTQMVQVTSPHGTFDAYLAVPESGSGPGVVVIQEIFGVNTHIRDVTERQRVQETLERQLDLETRIAVLSRRFLSDTVAPA